MITIISQLKLDMSSYLKSSLRVVDDQINKGSKGGRVQGRRNRYDHYGLDRSTFHPKVATYDSLIKYSNYS